MKIGSEIGKRTMPDWLKLFVLSCVFNVAVIGTVNWWLKRGYWPAQAPEFEQCKDFYKLGMVDGFAQGITRGLEAGSSR